MINKKLLAVAAIASVLSTSSAFAKTEGNYVGLNVLKSNINSKDSSGKTNYKDYGFGVDYKYAFNFNGAFIAPGAFFDSITNLSRKNQGAVANHNKFYRYGIKTNVGYDITNDLSAYLVAGAAANTTSYHTSIREKHQNQTMTKVGFLYGLGTSYNLSKDVTLSAEFNREKVTFANTQSSNFPKDKATDTVSVAQIGVAYHF